jgi:hypothetical protein
MKLLKIEYSRDGNLVRNWINIDTIQSITDGDAPECYKSIISYPDHKMFFDRRTPEQFIRDMKKAAKE